MAFTPKELDAYKLTRSNCIPTGTLKGLNRLQLGHQVTEKKQTRKGVQRVWGLHIIGGEKTTEKEILLSLIKHLCSKYLQKEL